MILDDGVTTIIFYPTAYEVEVRDFTDLQFGHSGKVISAPNGGKPCRRSRKLTLRRDTTERAALKAFFDTNDGAEFQFTDDVGRIWDAKWLGEFKSTEDAYAADGWHRVDLELLLTGVNSDAGRTAYANTDVSMMSMLKSGGTALYWPTAYKAPFNRSDRGTVSKIPTDVGLFTDAARFTARQTLAMNFGGLPAAFVSELEDYLVDTLQGAANKFDLTHFRDGTTSYRWTGGARFTLDHGQIYAGAIALREEV